MGNVGLRRGGCRGGDAPRAHAFLLPLFLVTFGAAALAVEKTYDDRVVIERGLKASQKLLGLIPAPRSVTTDPGAFGKSGLVAQVSALRAADRAVSLALRRQRSAEEINARRRELRAAVAKFLRELDAYKKVYASVAAMERQYQALRRVKPPKCSS